MRAVVSQAYIAIHKAKIVIQIPLFDAINHDKFRFLTKYEIKGDELRITFDSPELNESRLGVSECNKKNISEETLV
jgi:hypothetical protein